ncbi:MAG: peptidoglycan DD-metalloendopeptidase family protein [Acidobacteria bacterium]|nr:peptidoglycan DD-metalloendopeptidase family protein [Acidobacteriota bacterium]
MTVALGLCLVPWSSAQTPAPDRAQAALLASRAAARIQALQREADGLASRERTLLEDLRKLEVERELRSAEYMQARQDIERIQREMADAEEQIGALEHTAVAQMPDLSARMVELYKLGNGGYLRLLLGVDDLRGMGRAYRFVSALQRVDRQRVGDHQRTLADLRKTRAALADRHAQALRAQEQAAAARTSAEKAAAAYADLVSRIDARRDLAAQLMGELQTAEQKLQRTILGAASGTATPAPLALPLRPFKGDLDWPVPGRVVGTFGRQMDRRFHTAVVSNGIRLASDLATPVSVIHEGTVAFAEPFSGFGNLVIVDHGGLAFSLYGFLGEVEVPAGTRVGKGQTIGTVGAALDGTPALYFELRIDGRPVDPLQWLKAR